MSTLPDGLPVQTLGWGVLDWGSTFLAQPDGARKGDTWVYTNEQARFILWFYAVDPLGRYAYRRGIIMRCKGFGKSPLIAAISCTELLGPVVFAGFDADGMPVGRPQPSPRVQLCGVSADQADNTMSLVVEMLGQGRAVDDYQLDVGRTRVLVPGGRLEPVTASVKSREGQRPTFASLDETGLWTPNVQGPAFAATIRRNLGKVGGRSVETTNMFTPGEDSVAEHTWEYYQSIVEGRAREAGLLMDSRSADPDVNMRDRDELMAALKYAYGDAAAYVDLERIAQEIEDPATTEADAKRFYLNLQTKGDLQWIGKERWDACESEEKTVEPGTRICLGFDGGIRDDSTALIGTVLETGLVFPIKVWERPDNDKDWEVDVIDVDATVRWAFERFRVVRMEADPAHWQDVLGRWALDFNTDEDNPIIFEFWTHRPLQTAHAIERFETAVHIGEFRHAGDATLTRHVLNCTVEETPYGKRIRKDAKGSARKIDAAVAAVLSYEARARAIADGHLDDNWDLNQIYGF